MRNNNFPWSGPAFNDPSLLSQPTDSDGNRNRVRNIDRDRDRFSGRMRNRNMRERDRLERRGRRNLSLRDIFRLLESFED
jgi:hypothetical protein